MCGKNMARSPLKRFIRGAQAKNIREARDLLDVLINLAKTDQSGSSEPSSSARETTVYEFPLRTESLVLSAAGNTVRIIPLGMVSQTAI